MPTLCCFGLGDCAMRLAGLMIPRGWSVVGTTRSESRLSALADRGVRPLLFDGAGGDEVAIRAALSDADGVLISIPPDADGCPAHRLFHGAVPVSSWVGLLSSTGVYGDHAGGWVTEGTTATPTTDLGENRLLAEGQWRGTHPGAVVFRLASIYGPGRSPIDQILAGRGVRLDHPAAVSRVHADDVARVLCASLGRPTPGEVFNVADLDPTTPLSFMDEAYGLLGAAKPPAIGEDHPAIPAITRKHLRDRKRVDGSKVLATLGVELMYPTGVEGLRQCLSAAGRGG